MIGLGLLVLFLVEAARIARHHPAWPEDWTPEAAPEAVTHFALASLRAEEQGEPDPMRTLNRTQYRAVRARRRELLRDLTPMELAAATGAQGEIEAMGPEGKAQYARRLDEALKGDLREPERLPRSKRVRGNPKLTDPKALPAMNKPALPPDHEVRIHADPRTRSEIDEARYGGASPPATSWRFANDDDEG